MSVDQQLLVLLLVVEADVEALRDSGQSVAPSIAISRSIAWSTWWR